MSTPASGDPLPVVEQAPQPAAEVLPVRNPTSADAWRIQYLDSLRYIFADRQWYKTLLVFALFLLIPVFQWVLFFGYLYEIAEHRHRRLPGDYPPFQVRRFPAYVNRGIWCFLLMNLVQTIIALPLNFVTQGSMYGTMFALQAGDWGAIGVAVVLPLLILGFLAFLLALQVLLTPCMMRGGFSQDFLVMVNFKWIGHYLRTMWLETTFVCLFVLFSSLVLLPLGCALACVGVYAAFALMAMMQGHLHCQLYELYLARGGEPIPLKPHMAASQPGDVATPQQN